MNNNTGNRPVERIPWSASQRMPRVLIPLLVLFLCILAVTLSPLTGTAATKAGQSSEQTDFHYLEGRWVRPDGGYVLDLRHISGDGNVRASYFNPRRIKVSRAELHVRNDGTIRLLIELRDVNYPGSTYNLLYDAKTDRFIGTYFQAVQKQTYDVEFVRAK